MSESVLNPNESLAIIQKVVNSTRQDYHIQRKFYILWGMLIAVASFSQYAILNQILSLPWFSPWILFPGIGLILSVFWGSSSKNSSLSYYNHFVLTMWFTLYIAMGLSLFISLFNQISPFPFLLICVGIGTSISGFLMKNRLFVLCGIIFGLGAIYCVYLPIQQQLLLNGACMIIGNVMPNLISHHV
ncbi:hypothetical protein [Aquirufa aurantiipilula]|uniref:Uncharacterized protein n=1 Tax=Aquirufa aurantiipilula TaxID=2696561 RepID=A0ABT6BKZ8_9BACT|nr:hypothetical protein [Aquirufa aurantiipilula]MBZ1326927.1 hypothetical protein [Aquirufa aurantiipilula]MDF5691161.1 hypothetical protein [Aquirufa aurantiipilula]